MAEPVYEVKLKEGVENPIAPTPPGMSEEDISSLVDSKAQAKAEEIATSKVEKLKEELAESLAGKKTGRYGERGPDSWDSLHDNIASEATEKAVRAAEERIKKEFELKDKAQEDKQKQTQAQVEAQQKEEWAQITAEWTGAVADGILPDIAVPIKEKLKSGVTADALTEEEQRDPGLRAYNEAVLLHIELKKTGKSNSFYRTVSQFYRRQPAGASAPVMGGAIASPGGGVNEDLSYAEVQANRKAKYGF